MIPRQCCWSVTLYVRLVVSSAKAGESTGTRLAEISGTIACGLFSLPPVLPEMLAGPAGGSCVPHRGRFPGVWPEGQS